MALLSATLSGADETVPVVHNEPITVRILGGKDGQPLAHLHLVLIAGYDRSDMHDQLYRAELLTDAHGQVRLPKQLANLPWLQVWVTKKPLCQANPRGASFSVELIRRDGVSAPNRCGTATVEDAPGVFTVFVKGKGKKAAAEMSVAKAEAPTSAPKAVATALPAAEAPARKPVVAVARPPAAQFLAAAIAAALPAAPAPTPAEKVLKSDKPARPIVAVAAAVPAPAPAAVAAKRLTRGSARTAAHRPVRRVYGRPVSRRARPVLASCPVQQPAATAESEDKPETAIVATPNAKPETAIAEIEDKPATVINATHKAKPASAIVATPNAKPATPTVATHKAKPAAGVRLAAATPGKPVAPPKQE
jgi:hypothetical protein